MKVSKVKKEGIKEMKCSKTGIIYPISDFRVHSKGYYLSYSKHWEREEAKRRRELKSGEVPKQSKQEVAVITITTPRGKKFKAYKTPIIGGRKAESSKTDIVLYFKKDVTRDEVRSAFRAYTSVPMTGIKAGKVTE